MTPLISVLLAMATTLFGFTIVVAKGDLLKAAPAWLVPVLFTVSGALYIWALVLAILHWRGEHKKEHATHPEPPAQRITQSQEFSPRIHIGTSAAPQSHELSATATAILGHMKRDRPTGYHEVEKVASALSRSNKQVWNSLLELEKEERVNRTSADQGYKGTLWRLDETELEREPERRDSELSTSRAKLIPIKFGRTPDNRCGLFIRNDGDPAFDISIEEPVSVGTSKLQFWGRTYPGLTKENGEFFIEANMEISTGYGLTAGALRDQMIQADLESITLKIRYRDLENKWVTSFEIIREFWEQGLRIAGIRQERV